MKCLEDFQLNAVQLASELAELEDLLRSGESLKEREVILPFFKARKHLTAALAFPNTRVDFPDRVGNELQLFGDFACDAVSGDSTTGSFTLVEFEDASPNSIFSKKLRGKPLRAWSPRFEHGFSQMVDWAWRLSGEGESQAVERTFGTRTPSFQFLLVIGRDADLGEADLARVRWRANNVGFGSYRMTCITFDQFAAMVSRRLLLAEQPEAEQT